MASTDQTRLFELLKKFTAECVVSLVAIIYQNEGRDVFAKYHLAALVERTAKRYFDRCAESLMTKDDEWLVERFDQMVAAGVVPLYHPLELLFIISQLAMTVVSSITIDLTDPDPCLRTAEKIYESDMVKITLEITNFLCCLDENASQLVGGCSDFNPSGKKYKFVFKIEIDDE